MGGHWGATLGTGSGEGQVSNLGLGGSGSMDLPHKQVDADSEFVKVDVAGSEFKDSQECIQRCIPHGVGQEFLKINITQG